MLVRVGIRAGHLGIELRWIKTPLFARVASEELLVKLTTHFANHHILGRLTVPDRLGARREKCLAFFVGGEVQVIKRVDCSTIDRNRQQLAIDFRKDAVLVLAPRCEL